MTYEQINDKKAKSSKKKMAKRTKSRAVRKNNKRLCTLILMGDLDRAASITIDAPKGWVV